MTDKTTEASELEMIRLMLASSCFGREVCPTPPCACARSMADSQRLHIQRLETDTRRALEALSLWVTAERQKYRVAGGMPAGGFDNMSPIEIALAKVEVEIDRRSRLFRRSEQ